MHEERSGLTEKTIGVTIRLPDRSIAGIGAECLEREKRTFAMASEGREQERGVHSGALSRTRTVEEGRGNYCNIQATSRTPP